MNPLADWLGFYFFHPVEEGCCCLSKKAWFLALSWLAGWLGSYLNPEKKAVAPKRKVGFVESLNPAANWPGFHFFHLVEEDGRP